MKNESTKLLSRAQQGDVEAFARLFENLRPAVLAVARRVAGMDDAEDVVMETYLKAWQALPRFRSRSSLKTWLYRIAYNCSLDFVRSRQRRKEVALSGDDSEQTVLERTPDEKQPTPDETIAGGELAEMVRGAMGQLPQEHRVALQLRFCDDLSYAEIAAATGVSIGTVMSRLFYAKRKLRKIIDDADND
jgi:RNA polymerase sigma-70 factor (ECF subfamily)